MFPNRVIVPYNSNSKVTTLTLDDIVVTRYEHLDMSIDNVDSVVIPDDLEVDLAVGDVDAVIIAHHAVVT